MLDYDTYFNVTDMLLGGDYLSALRLFDEVLAKGFSGQTFMAGLAQHMRDLLVARDAASVSLIELTGTLLERYRAQAGRCTIEFLFGAISLLTEADGRIRQSSNQRLLVELGLMKIAGLGQKKNDGVALGTSYPAAHGAERPGGKSPTYDFQTECGSDIRHDRRDCDRNSFDGNSGTRGRKRRGGVRRGCHHARGGSRPAGNGRRRTGRRTARNSTHAGKGPGSAGVPTCRGDKRRIAHRRRIAVVAAEPGTAGEAAEQPQPAVTIDPASGQKLESGRTAILDYIRQERPRLYAFFEQLRIEGHTLRLAVPTEALREEILRSKLEMLTRIAAIAGVEGALELEVTINEQIRAVRPIKLEDRLRHMNEKNPLLAELRRELDLEVE